ncbi:MAG: hypothetical protein ACHQNV_03490 [Vicinamibacteria bacterium]
MRVARYLGPPLLLAFSLLVTLTITEGFFTLLLMKPSLLRAFPATTVSHVRHYYLAHDRNMIQAMRECARFDTGLFYTLRPGTFRFRNREFDNEFRVNSLGVRDEESALQAPQVVVLGDSYAMGWGVDQDKTIAKTIERKTGLRSLNAGIASYGTVREMRLLDRIDTRALRDLVIVYCNDDVLENRPFLSHGDFTVGEAGQYEEDVRRAERRKRYWVGRRTFEFLRDVLAPETEPGPRAANPEDEARYFVNAVRRAGHTDLSRVRIIALEVSQFRLVDSHFALAVRKEVGSDTYPAFIRDMVVLDLVGRLKPEHYYDLDDHLREEGQLAVADAVIEALRGDEAQP